MNVKSKCWAVRPQESINGISFGTSRKKVRELIGGKFAESKKTITSSNTTDSYDSFHVYYDEKDLMEAVEIFGDINVSINGTIVFPGDLECVKAMIPDLRFDSGSYISKELSIGIYAPDDCMESILVAKKDYYSMTDN